MHGRGIALNGSYYENIFVHFKPRSAVAGKWYKHDYNHAFGRPVVEWSSLEELQRVDSELAEEAAAIKTELRDSPPEPADRLDIKANSFLHDLQYSIDFGSR